MRLLLAARWGVFPTSESAYSTVLLLRPHLRAPSRIAATALAAMNFVEVDLPHALASLSKQIRLLLTSQESHI